LTNTFTFNYLTQQTAPSTCYNHVFETTVVVHSYYNGPHEVWNLTSGPKKILNFISMSIERNPFAPKNQTLRSSQSKYFAY